MEKQQYVPFGSETLLTLPRRMEFRDLRSTQYTYLTVLFHQLQSLQSTTRTFRVIGAVAGVETEQITMHRTAQFIADDLALIQRIGGVGAIVFDQVTLPRMLQQKIVGTVEREDLTKAIVQLRQWNKGKKTHERMLTAERSASLLQGHAPGKTQAPRGANMMSAMPHSATIEPTRSQVLGRIPSTSQSQRMATQI